LDILQLTVHSGVGTRGFLNRGVLMVTPAVTVVDALDTGVAISYFQVSGPGRRRGMPIKKVYINSGSIFV
jgi:hypothetical protein